MNDDNETESPSSKTVTFKSKSDGMDLDEKEDNDVVLIVIIILVAVIVTSILIFLITHCVTSRNKTRVTVQGGHPGEGTANNSAIPQESEGYDGAAESRRGDRKDSDRALSATDH